MGEFVKGDVVTVSFPFSDLSGSKKRPAIVLANLTGDDIILCQITSKSKSDPFAVPLTTDDFVSGGLPIDSFIRPGKIFTAYKSLILSSVGHLSDDKIRGVVNSVITLISS